jgi:hypothetical protein
MAAKLEILELQTSAQRQKSRPIEHHLFFISHTKIFHANFSPRIISLQIISRQALSRPLHPFFFPHYFLSFICNQELSVVWVKSIVKFSCWNPQG